MKTTNAKNMKNCEQKTGGRLKLKVRKFQKWKAEFNSRLPRSRGGSESLIGDSLRIERAEFSVIENREVIANTDYIQNKNQNGFPHRYLTRHCGVNGIH